MAGQLTRGDDPLDSFSNLPESAPKSGTLIMQRMIGEHLEPGMAGMRMLAVDPSAQGAGAGRALVEGCIEVSRGHGLRCLSLHTHVVFARARALYERMGFVRTPDRDLHFGDDLHLLSYLLDPV